MVCWASAQPTPSGPVPPHVIHQSTRFRPRMCLWEGLIDTSYPMGSCPPKPPHFRTSMGISSINVYGCISAKKKHFITLDGSKCASRQDSQCAIRKIRGWGHFRRQIYKIYKRLFQRQIYSHYKNAFGNSPGGDIFEYIIFR